MELFREIRKIESDKLTIEIPASYRHKNVEILIRPCPPTQQSPPPYSFESMSKISIDTSNYKFDREKLHER